MQIGMIGLQSRHLDFFASQINLEKRFPGVAVTGVWGDDEVERLPDVAIELGIPNICGSAEELMELCDTVFVLPRNGFTHMSFARLAQRHGKNLFVDKAFATCAADADELIRTAQEKDLALTGGATLCYLPIVQQLKEKIHAVRHCTISYFADPDSIYGGWAYYGSHLCDLCTCLCGAEFRDVIARKRGKEVIVTVSYDGMEVTLHSTVMAQKPVVSLGDPWNTSYELDDTVCFRYGLDGFVRELESKTGESLIRLRASAALLEGCLSSLKTGERVSF